MHDFRHSLLDMVIKFATAYHGIKVPKQRSMMACRLIILLSAMI